MEASTKEPTWEVGVREIVEVGPKRKLQVEIWVGTRGSVGFLVDGFGVVEELTIDRRKLGFVRHG